MLQDCCKIVPRLLKTLHVLYPNFVHTIYQKSRLQPWRLDCKKAIKVNINKLCDICRFMLTPIIVLERIEAESLSENEN